MFGDLKPLSSLDMTLLSLKIALDPRLVKEHLFNLRNYFPAISQTSWPLTFGPCLMTPSTQPLQKHTFLNKKNRFFLYTFYMNHHYNDLSKIINFHLVIPNITKQKKNIYIFFTSDVLNKGLCVVQQ